jgi:two-component system nitrate/nitrite response regulator NarL
MMTRGRRPGRVVIRVGIQEPPVPRPTRSRPWSPGPSGVTPLRVVVIAGIRLNREGLALLLRTGNSRVEVVGVADQGVAAVALVASARPAVAIVDASMVAVSDLIPSLRGAHPPVRVVAFGVRDVAEVVECAEAGIAGYVFSEAGLTELVRVLAAVERDELQCSPEVAGALLRRVTQLSWSVGPTAQGEQEADGRPRPMTARELEIAVLIGEGLMNKQIAHRLGISLSTVKNHVHKILEKQDVTSRTHLSVPRQHGGRRRA